MNEYFPSIWLGNFRSKSEYDEKSHQLAEAFSVYDWIDDQLIFSRHPFTFPAFCSFCTQVVNIRIDWTIANVNEKFGSINPAWTETSICEKCNLNSRIRALIGFIRTKYDFNNFQNVYIAEQVTPLYRKLKKIVPSLVGSEYLGPEYKSGEIIIRWRNFSRVRHEDLTALSFPDSEFELVMSLDVFEHIPDYKESFREMWRILIPGGHLVFTIPFYSDLKTTQIRASNGRDGIIHYLQPEIHGNPISPNGSLCYQNFGWQILQDLLDSGFSDAMASLYWGPWQGHLGYPTFIFSASK